MLDVFAFLSNCRIFEFDCGAGTVLKFTDVFIELRVMKPVGKKLYGQKLN